ncbi:MAG: ribosome maturation factor RimM [Kofleriaceae bacterium]
MAGPRESGADGSDGVVARIEIGGVARAHGIKGEVVIVTHDPESTTLGEIDAVWIAGKRYGIAIARDTHKGWLVGLEGIVTRNDAELLQGKPVEIERAELELDEDDVLLADMIGCTVRLPDGRDWGVIAHIDANEFQDLIVIHDGEIERLLPLVDEFVTQIDLDERVVHVDPPEGLPESKR